LGKYTVHRWARRNLKTINNLQTTGSKEIVIFVDEFTNYNDSEIGVKALKLLAALGYRLLIPKTAESGRSFISKGLIRTARKKAEKNIEILKGMVSPETPLVGIEPSAILSFRDEYPELVREEFKSAAGELAANTFMIEEFLVSEIEKNEIKKEMFTSRSLKLKLHGHCQQKAIAGTSASIKCLGFPENYTVTEIPSGCCGMAGSFGYEKEHYDLSQKVGELVLFPSVRNSDDDTVIVAPGTSCRHQIKDGTGRRAYHPVEILYDALGD
jgi:Fe-S oxidoreductase